MLLLLLLLLLPIPSPMMSQVKQVLKVPGAPYQLQSTPWEIRSPAPTLGQHNQAVLSERLGEDLSSLKEAGVI